jgi:hypothetical protein
MVSRFLAISGWVVAMALGGYAVVGKLYHQGDLAAWCGTGQRPPIPPPPTGTLWWVVLGLAGLSVVGLLATFATRAVKKAAGKVDQLVG